MRKTVFVLLSMLVSVNFAYGVAKQSETDALFEVYVSGKCGYINQKGEIAVKPRFYYCEVFSEGLAGVVVEGKLGFIDARGVFVIQPRFDSSYSYFHEGLAMFIIRERNENGEVETERRGYVNKAGQLFFLSTNISEASDFHEGLAVAESQGLKGYINTEMQFVIAPQFKYAGSFGSGLASVCETNGSCYYVNKTGAKAIDKKGSDFVNGLAIIEEGGKYGFMNTKGQTAIAPRFAKAGYFHGELAKVEIDGRWGYVDRAGNVLIAAKYDEADEFFSDGITAVRVNKKWGFIDSKGEMLVAPRFDYAVWYGDGVGKVVIKGKTGYINQSGEYVWRPSA